MKRIHWLLVVVGMVFVAAIALRVSTLTDRKKISVDTVLMQRKPPVSIPAPRDYVMHPEVHPEEANKGAKRIISLAPSITEIVCALGLGDRLIGRTQYCEYPPMIKSVPTVGAMDANFEKIISLKPDLVLVTDNNKRVVDGLKQMDIPFRGIAHGSLEETYEAILEIGSIGKRPKTAKMLVDAIKKDIESLKVNVKELSIPSRRVMVVLGKLPVPPTATFVAGPGIFLDRLVQTAGHKNVARKAINVEHGQLPLEKLCVLNPEVILEFREPVLEEDMVDLYTSWAEVGSIQAIERLQVRSVGGGEWLSAGPRIAIELHHFITVLSEFR